MDKMGAWNPRSNKQKNDIIACAETNIVWNNKQIAQAKKIMRDKKIKNTMITSSSTIKGKSNYYQPGGTATIITEKWTGRVTNPIHDNRGCRKWNGVSIRINTKKYLHLISTYRPTKGETDLTFYKQNKKS